MDRRNGQIKNEEIRGKNLFFIHSEIRMVDFEILEVSQLQRKLIMVDLYCIMSYILVYSRQTNKVLYIKVKAQGFYASRINETKTLKHLLILF